MISFILLCSFVGFLIAIYAWFISRRAFKFWNCTSRKIEIIFKIFICLAVLAVCTKPASLAFIIVIQLALWYFSFDLIHLVVKILRAIFKKRFECKIFHKLYRCSLVPICIVLCLTCYGVFNMNRISTTQYDVEVSGDLIKKDYKILFISDLHFDTIQDKNLLKEQIDLMNEENADFVVLGGDICDEGTSFESMKEVFEVCGKIKSKYGSFYVYGNHDRQLYSSKPHYSIEELENVVSSNGIKLLQDEVFVVNDDLILIGREDYGMVRKYGRTPIENFLSTIPENYYVIVLDHQPHRKEVQTCLENGCDLQLSGHTHAGQIFPFGEFMQMAGGFCYGYYRESSLEKNMDLIVSSGFTGWGFPMRTEEKCEWVVVNLKKG